MKRKIKVLYVQHTGTYGGPCRSLGFVLPYLQDQGIEAHVLSPKGKAQDYYRHFTPHVHSIHHHGVSLLQTVINYGNARYLFWRHMISTIQYKRKIKKVLQELQPDIVHLNEYGLFPIAKVAKSLGIATVAHARTMPHEDRTLLNRYIFSSVDKYVDHLFCISGSVYNKMRGIANKSITYNPVESMPPLKTFDPNANVINFLSLSAVRKSKGILELLEAARQLEDDKRIHMIVAGKLDLDKPKLTTKQKILSLLGHLNVKEANYIKAEIKDFQQRYDHISFIGQVDDIDTLMAEKIDVMLAPMRLNSPPRSVFEAGIHGIPSVLSMEEKVEDVVKDGVTGYLIDEAAPDQLVAAMKKMVDNPENRIKMGQQARKRAMKNHDATIIGEFIFQKYQEVLKVNGAKE